MQIVLGLIFALSVQSAAFAGTCKAVHWPFAKKVKNIQPILFQAIPRENLYRYLYAEISSKPEVRVRGLAANLFFYLKNTEQNEDRYQMLMAFEWAADLQTNSPRVFSIAEICGIEHRIERDPSSNRKAKIKTQAKKPTSR